MGFAVVWAKGKVVVSVMVEKGGSCGGLGIG